MATRLFAFMLVVLMGLASACGGGGDDSPFVPDPDDPDDPPPSDTSTTSSDKPDSLPHFASLSLYSASSPFNQTIPADAAVDPGSDAMIQKLQDSGAFVISVRSFSSPVFIADASTPRVSVGVPCGTEWGMGISTFQNVPIPAWSEPADDGQEGSPSGCGEGSEEDNHMVVLDLEARCEYDFWQMRKVGGAWQASWANSISMDDDGVYDKGLSTRGSGFAFPGGLIWPDELKNGAITHALSFNLPFTRSGGPVAPATDSDGITDGDDAIPEGALLQLDPSFDVSGLSGYELTVARALQTYGMYVADTGGDAGSGVSLYAVDPKSTKSDPYAGVLPDEAWPGLPNIPLSSFRVIKMGPQDSGWEEKLDLVSSGCGQMG